LAAAPARIWERGIGTETISAAVDDSWLSFPDIPALVVAVVVANTRSDPAHYVYRVDRPDQ